MAEQLRLEFTDGHVDTIELSHAVEAKHNGLRSLEFRELKEGKWILYYVARLFGGRKLRRVSFTNTTAIKVDVESYLEAAKQMDWMQVVLNGGPPCFHIGEDGHFCGRAQRWAGHDDVHQFKSLADMIQTIAPDEA